jgi:large subunit ribosomal protein L15
MNLSSIKPAKGSVKTKTRKGRGTGSGKGGTSTRGHKGAQSRSGYSAKNGFEGGQMPLQRRVPKFGFKNLNRVEYKAINLDVLQALLNNNAVEVIDFEFMRQHGLVSKMIW